MTLFLVSLPLMVLAVALAIVPLFATIRESAEKATAVNATIARLDDESLAEAA